MEIANLAKLLLTEPKVKFLMLRYRKCEERLNTASSANKNFGGKSYLPWDWFIVLIVLGGLALMRWERFNQILTPVILIFFVISLFFIYFFRVKKWDISGPIFKFNTNQELGWWRNIFERKNYFQTEKNEIVGVETNKTITANLVDCLSCGHQVPVGSEKCIQCGALYLLSANN